MGNDNEDKVEELDFFLTKSIMIGNAAGLLATLTFIGNRLSSAPGEGFGLALYLVLIGYFLGICSTWLSLISDFFKRLAIKSTVAEHPDYEDYQEAARIISKGDSCYVFAAVICFVGSSLVAFVLLWQLA